MSKSRRPDLATILGLALALAGIVGGLLLEGGSLADVGQLTAALIVLGGTIGATMVNTPMQVLKGAMRRLASAFFESQADAHKVLDEIIEYAARARKSGIVSLEEESSQIPDPFLRKAMTLAVDGADPQEIRKMMELEIALAEHRVESEAKVFESAGGYAPTIGIIGAVMGLIQVMKHLENIEEVGHGIAVAFVATVYGVGVSNLFFLPVAAKIKSRGREQSEVQEMMLEGVVSIVEGLNPKLIRSKLEAFLHTPPARAKTTSSASPASPKEQAA